MTIKPFLDPAQTITDLRNAVTWINEHPWGQGDDYDATTGCFCAYGAIRAAIGAIVITDGHYRTFDSFASAQTDEDQEKVRDLRDRASNCARAFYRIIGTELTSYNDTDGRTKDQVIRAMEVVVAALEENPNRA